MLPDREEISFSILNKLIFQNVFCRSVWQKRNEPTYEATLPQRSLDKQVIETFAQRTALDRENMEKKV